MDHSQNKSCISPLLLLLVFISCLAPLPALAYQNFTVGGDKGWVYPVVVNYTQWAQGKSFTLGDFLIFKYPKKNDSVIVTQNRTLYRSCDQESGSNDFDTYGEAGKDVESDVPLLETGMTYFFSGNENGVRCKAGLRFAINVTVGEGLPASLIPRPPPPPEQESPQATPIIIPGPPGSSNNPNGAVGLYNVAATKACFFFVLLSMSFLM